ncbi:major intrinsic protein [alpha proteobacterium IMCC14465]|uniref:Major intrinsic protein n=1 Tax=alpha proteobacterium IMCC14465 TaxID=1220535 RepID=J9A4J3_9PROT|nr:major intrinsic protein [alpha proteobacterium IMCC14465]
MIFDTRKLASEFIGTLFLVATVVGSGIMAETLAEGNAAVALLGNTLATAGILYVLITCLGPVSGAHFNPAVSVVFWLKGELGAVDCTQYIVFQCLGAMAGVMLAHAMFDQSLIQTSVNMRYGSNIWLAESVATFGLVATILTGLRHRPESVASLVSLYITAGYWFTASTSFANPAVTLGRSFTDSFSGIRLCDMPFFVLAQLLGAVLAYYLVRALLPKNNTE